MEEGMATDAQLDEIEAMVQKEVDKAVEVAESSPDPLPEDALRDVYAGDGGI